MRTGFIIIATEMKKGLKKKGPPAPPVRPKGVMTALLAAGVFAAAVLLFIPSWKNPFILDDVAKIEANPDMRLPFSLRHFFYPYSENSGEFRNDPARPITFMVFWLCWRAGSGSPLPFHVVNTLLHALVAVLLAWLAALSMRRLFRVEAPEAGPLAAFLFLSSPLMAGTVIYAYGLSDVLSTALCLGALLLLVRRQEPGPGAQVLASALFILALGAKQSAVVLPALVVAWDWFTGGAGEVKRRVRVVLPLVLLACVYLGARWLTFGRLGDLEGGAAVYRTALYASMQGAVMLAYLKLMGLPAGLTIDHLPAAEAYPLWLRLAAWAVVGALSVLAVKAGFKRSSSPVQRLLGFGWLMFVITLLPTSSFLPTVDLMVERRAYFAGAGVFLILAGLLWHLGRRDRVWRSALLVAAAAAVLAQAAVTWHRHAVYGSPEALWRESLARNPMNRRALSNLGTFYSRVERWDDAVGAFEKILSHNPGDGAIYTKLAYIYAQPSYPGRDDRKALEYLDRGLALNPDNFLGLFNKAIILIRTERFVEAEESLRRAVALSPHYVAAHFMLGEVALRMGRKDEAVVHFREVLRLNPGDPAATDRLREITGR
jgi:tetratricopeptide (TPR) repeat protein